MPSGQFHSREVTYEQAADIMAGDTYYHGIRLWIKPNSVDLSPRHKQIREYALRFPTHVTEADMDTAVYRIIVGSQAWDGFQRRNDTLPPICKGFHKDRTNTGVYYSGTYEYNASGNKYVLSMIPSQDQ